MAKIGLVLAGGLAKGAYQAGVLRAIGELFSPTDFSCISAASVGVLNAYGFASGRLDYAWESWNSISADGGSMLITSMLHSPTLKKAIDGLWAENDRLPCPLYCALLDLGAFTCEYVNLQQVDPTLTGRYLHAAIAMPLGNLPVKIGKQRFFDGGYVDNIPVYPLLAHKPDYIICCHFDGYHYMYEDEDTDSRILEIVFPDDKLMSRSIFFQHESIVYMMQAGYDNARAKLEAIFGKGTEDVERIRAEIRALNEADGSQRPRLTFDVAITNLNKMSRRLTRKKIR